ncbi:DUF5071 domain-containing protein [Chryseobacterium sp. Leaf180]|uniref:DUF5071 domain-containing protein n=1 Tax=Chryseobacterium sp. Leaf180 TaxID=1736289 RepID=UPI0009E678A5|nr:DUF5071 domain-containing protein [Chryseobacterium sp. Leaf180]
MNLQDLVPKEKDDDRHIVKLKKLSFEEIQPIIPDLLEWLQDINWPIASDVADVLEPFADKLTPYLMEVLISNDGMWKYWILTIFGRETRDEVFLKEINRIATNPTRDEIDCEVDMEAQAILNGDYN